MQKSIKKLKPFHLYIDGITGLIIAFIYCIRSTETELNFYNGMYGITQMDGFILSIGCIVSSVFVSNLIKRWYMIINVGLTNLISVIYYLAAWLVI